jgi:hypothetical protein
MRSFVLRACVVLAALPALSPHRLAGSETPTRHHVIVVLDRSMSMRLGPSTRRQEVETMIRERLPDALFDPARGPQAGRALLDPAQGDVLSVVTYALDIDPPSDFSQFIQTDINGVPFGFLRQADPSRATFQHLWSTIVDQGYENFFSPRWSGIGVAKALALEYQGLHGSLDAPPVHRTFVVVVDDNDFNGINPSGELSQLSKDFPSLRDDVELMEARVARVGYLYDFKPQFSLAEGDIHLKVFQAVRNMDSFSVGTLWIFDQGGVQFNRVRGGFRSDYVLQPVPSAELRPVRVAAELLDEGSVLDRQEFAAGTAQPRVRFSVPEAASRRPLKVRLRFWVRQSDHVYGMNLLDPDAADSAVAAALVHTVPARFQPPSAIFGSIRVGPRTFAVASFFGADDQEQAAQYWEVTAVVFIALLAAAAVLAWAWRHSAVTNPRVMRDHRI